MKYDNQVFKLSIDAYKKMQADDNDDEIKKKQNNLLKLLLTKFEEELKTKGDHKNGILKIQFKKIFWSDFNDGYREIDELVKSNHFDSFASEYCMYIGKVEDRCDEFYSAYYEIIWDYKTYYEQLKNKHKRVVEEIKKEKRKNERNKKRKECEEKGHDFGMWKEEKWTTIEEYGPSGIEALFTGVGTRKVEHLKWTRRCKRCGEIQSSNKKPNEIEANEIKEQIQVLQKKLKDISN